MNSKPAETLVSGASPEQWRGGVILPVHSHFSVEVFKTIRVGIPRSEWPSDHLVGLFVPTGDAMALMAEFEDVPEKVEATARALVMARGAELVLLSPFGTLAVEAYKVRRWRDTSLYGLVPALFGIPIMASLLPNGFASMTALALADLLILVISQVKMLALRHKLLQSRFIAMIPSPGARIKIS